MKYKVLSLVMCGVAMAFAADVRAEAETAEVAAAEVAAAKKQLQAQAGADCSAMTASEQNFASKLTDPALKTAFCNQFTPDQRASCMQMGMQPDAQGNMMTPDQCVRKTMQGGASAAQAKTGSAAAPAKATNKASACPAK